ncbi:MAG: hypothetical protein AAF503_10040, partial [Pseudomonadota bacterium]
RDHRIPQARGLAQRLPQDLSGLLLRICCDTLGRRADERAAPPVMTTTLFLKSFMTRSLKILVVEAVDDCVPRQGVPDGRVRAVRPSPDIFTFPGAVFNEANRSAGNIATNFLPSG